MVLITKQRKKNINKAKSINITERSYSYSEVNKKPKVDGYIRMVDTIYGRMKNNSCCVFDY